MTGASGRGKQLAAAAIGVTVQGPMPSLAGLARLERAGVDSVWIGDYFQSGPGACDASVPIDTIERAIKRGTGELEGVRYESISYEGYAPDGVAVIVETPDRQPQPHRAPRSGTSSTKNGGSMAEPGAVSWQFERKGVVARAPVDLDEDRVMEVAMEAGAEDLVGRRRALVVTCARPT